MISVLRHCIAACAALVQHWSLSSTPWPQYQYAGTEHDDIRLASSYVFVANAVSLQLCTGKRHVGQTYNKVTRKELQTSKPQHRHLRQNVPRMCKAYI